MGRKHKCWFIGCRTKWKIRGNFNSGGIWIYQKSW